MNSADRKRTFSAMASRSCVLDWGGVNYRILYFFHGKEAVVLAHGLTKERVVPPREIDEAIRRKRKFEQDPDKHTYQEA